MSRNGPEGLVAFAGTLDLASGAVGGAAIAASDDFFAAKDHLVDPRPAAFDPTTYGERGKIMDGWESRRKRVPGHDWCIVRLGIRGEIHGVDIDTSFFLGNHPPFASLDATDATDAAIAGGTARWTRILPSIPLDRGSHNLQVVRASGTFSHVRLNIYPDGGVARLRVHGIPARPAPTGDDRIDLVALAAGGRPLACSDMFFSPMTNLLLPGRSSYMGNGWETRRSRPPGRDWWIGALGVPGAIEAIELDTGHFKGNYPDRAVVDGLWWPDAPPQVLIDHEDWAPITAETKLRADALHTLPATATVPCTHVRLRIFPDGGVARMRVWGRAARPAPDAVCAALDVDDPRPLLQRCCGSARWVEEMAALGPFSSRTHLLGAAAEVWWHLDERDWLEAFSHHPRIGADPDTLRARFASTASLSAREQAGVAGADEATLSELAKGNAAYEAKFGHVFLICATGLSASTMLAALRARIDNERAAELRIAAGEQVKILRLRLLGLGGGA